MPNDKNPQTSDTVVVMLKVQKFRKITKSNDEADPTFWGQAQ